MENIAPLIVCSSCQAPVTAEENFCPKCGVELKEPPFTISTGRLVFVYLVSFFLAPFGLGYAFKYLRHSSPEARKIGIIVVILTVLAIALMIGVSVVFTGWEAQSLDMSLY
jgi:hypothetical protein